MAGLVDVIARAGGRAARQGAREVRRQPRRRLPAPVQAQVRGAVRGALHQVIRSSPHHPSQSVAAALPAVRKVDRAQRRDRRERLAAQRAPIVNPFVASVRGEPFRLGQDMAHSKALIALRNSYTPATAMREYRQFMEATFKRAGRRYPGAGRRMPRTDFSQPGYLLATTTQRSSRRVLPPRRRSVHFTPRDAWAYVLNDRGDSSGDFARFAPLHEWAHVFQRGPAVAAYPRGSSHALVEGGAQAFAQQVAAGLGLPVQSRASNPEYAALAGYVRRRKGQRYVGRGQFGR